MLYLRVGAFGETQFFNNSVYHFLCFLRWPEFASKVRRKTDIFTNRQRFQNNVFLTIAKCNKTQINIIASVKLQTVLKLLTYFVRIAFYLYNYDEFWLVWSNCDSIVTAKMTTWNRAKFWSMYTEVVFEYWSMYIEVGPMYIYWMHTDIYWYTKFYIRKYVYWSIYMYEVWQASVFHCDHFSNHNVYRFSWLFNVVTMHGSTTWINFVINIKTVIRQIITKVRNIIA